MSASKPVPASCSTVPVSGLQMSKPWLPATTRSATPMSSWTTARSRPETTHTVQRRASPRTTSRMLGARIASCGRATIGVSVPS